MVNEKNLALKTPQTIPILMYHHITLNEEECSNETITLNKFKQDMVALKENGYNTISFKQLYDFVENKKLLPKNPIIITFDDGYSSNFTLAYPVLKDLKMKATIHIIGQMVDKKYVNGIATLPHFSYNEAKNMFDSGLIDIQSHTYNLHNYSIRPGILKLEKETVEQYTTMLTNDFLKSKNEIEKNVGNSVFVFAYPYGLHDNLSEEILKNLGIKITVTTNEGVSKVIPNVTDSLYNLDRINVGCNLTTNELMKKIKEYSNI